MRLILSIIFTCVSLFSFSQDENDTRNIPWEVNENQIIAKCDTMRAGLGAFIPVGLLGNSIGSVQISR